MCLFHAIIYEKRVGVNETDLFKGDGFCGTNEDVGGCGDYMEELMVVALPTLANRLVNPIEVHCCMHGGLCCDM